MIQSRWSAFALLFAVVAFAAYFIILGLFGVPLAALAVLAFVAVGLCAWVGTKET